MKTLENQTLIATSPIETDKSDITYLPTSNADFLSAIFEGISEPHRPFVLGFSGTPKARKAWVLARVQYSSAVRDERILRDCSQS